MTFSCHLLNIDHSANSCAKIKQHIRYNGSKLDSDIKYFDCFVKKGSIVLHFTSFSRKNIREIWAVPAATKHCSTLYGCFCTRGPSGF
ncbi:hypothetical protein F7725_016910 [Dissostichus mawsoni]|uniref:Uncharacterized protein n=1 Tax=Dissostichus mawsoni TaxID=36200 RepID=A0A7J5Z5X8_DISMA|nr:hypothetical protein F7725_016910 [Dissostichus mawsoni]